MVLMFKISVDHVRSKNIVVCHMWRLVPSSNSSHHFVNSTLNVLLVMVLPILYLWITFLCEVQWHMSLLDQDSHDLVI